VIEIFYVRPIKSFSRKIIMQGADSSKAFERLKRKIEGEVLWLYVSSILMEEGGLSVVELKKRLRERFSIATRSVYLYTVLYRMERESLVKKRTGTRGEAVYFLEEKGKEVYLKGLEYLKNKVDLLRGSSSST
jgi:DNA-binding PadR family transcriptional regulator